jgi:hypothetical protein
MTPLPPINPEKRRQRLLALYSKNRIYQAYARVHNMTVEQRLEADDYHTILPATPFDTWFKHIRAVFGERHPEHMSTWSPTIIKNLPAWFAWVDALEPGDV